MSSLHLQSSNNYQPSLQKSTNETDEEPRRTYPIGHRADPLWRTTLLSRTPDRLKDDEPAEI